jgi:hypothetical protein
LARKETAGTQRRERNNALHAHAVQKIHASDEAQDETAQPQTCYAFRFRAYWFVLAQTEGEEMYVPPIPGFDIDTALRALNITRTSFDEMNGNIQGFANGREIAVNPLAALAT